MIVGEAINILAENVDSLNKKRRVDSLQRRNAVVDLYGYEFSRHDCDANHPAIIGISISQDLIYYSRFEFKIALQRINAEKITTTNTVTKTRTETVYEGKEFKPVTSLSQVDNKWLQYAVTRTGVNLPNCFTYSTARISQIVGYNQPLDTESKVPYAGMLWDSHHANFTKSNTPVLGALAIWQGTGAWYAGHVANVEAISGDKIRMSQSNYGGTMYENVTVGSKVGTTYPNTTLKLVGYLVHKDLKERTSKQVEVEYTEEVKIVKEADPNFNIYINDVNLTPYFKAQFNGEWINSVGIYPTSNTANYDVLWACGYMSEQEREKVLKPGYNEIKITGVGTFDVTLINYLKYSHVNR